MLMCSCVRLLVVVNNMWVIIEFRLGSIFVLLFSEIIKRSIIVSVSVRFLILIIVSLDFIYISFFRNRYGEICAQLI